MSLSLNSIPSSVCLDSIPFLAFPPAVNSSTSPSISTTETVRGLTPGSIITLTATNGLVDAGTISLSGVFEAQKVVTVSQEGSIVVAAKGNAVSILIGAIINGNVSITCAASNENLTNILIGSHAFTPPSIYFTSSDGLNFFPREDLSELSIVAMNRDTVYIAKCADGIKQTTKQSTSWVPLTVTFQGTSVNPNVVQDLDISWVGDKIAIVTSSYGLLVNLTNPTVFEDVQQYTAISAKISDGNIAFFSITDTYSPLASVTTQYFQQYEFHFSYLSDLLALNSNSIYTRKSINNPYFKISKDGSKMGCILDHRAIFSTFRNSVTTCVGSGYSNVAISANGSIIVFIGTNSLLFSVDYGNTWNWIESSPLGPLASIYLYNLYSLSDWILLDGQQPIRSISWTPELNLNPIKLKFNEHLLTTNLDIAWVVQDAPPSKEVFPLRVKNGDSFYAMITLHHAFTSSPDLSSWYKLNSVRSYDLWWITRDNYFKDYIYSSAWVRTSTGFGFIQKHIDNSTIGFVHTTNWVTFTEKPIVGSLFYGTLDIAISSDRNLILTTTYVANEQLVGSLDSGVTWQIINIPTALSGGVYYVEYIDTAFYLYGEGYFITDVILTTTDLFSYDYIPLPCTFGIYSLVKLNNTFIASDGYKYNLISTDLGKTWSLWTSPFFNKPYDVWKLHATSSLFVFCKDNGVPSTMLYISDNGVDWVVAGSSEDSKVYDIVGDTIFRGVDMLASSSSTQLSFSTDTLIGNSWVSRASLNVAIGGNSSVGELNSALSFDGYYYYTQYYNGISWESRANTLSQHIGTASAGHTASALAFAGNPYTGGDNAERYDGSVWTHIARIPIWIEGNAGCGVSTSALSFGGTSGSNGLSDVYQYDGTSWAVKTTMPTTSLYLAGIGNTSKSLAIGGTTMVLYPAVAFSTVQEYDSTSWTTGASLTTARHSAGSAGMPSNTLVFCGRPSNVIYSELYSSEKYNGVVWSANASYIYPLYRVSGCGSSGNFAVGVGGGDTGSVHSKAVAHYTNVTGNVLSSVIVPPTTVGALWWGQAITISNFSEASSVGVTASALRIGGWGPTSTSTVEFFNGTAWYTKANTNYPKARHTSCGKASSALAICGSNESNYYNSFVEFYDGTAWTDKASTLDSSWGGSSVGIPTSALYFGYFNDSAVTTSVQKYDGTTWSTQSILSSGTYSGAGTGSEFSALSFGGNSFISEYYNGSTWEVKDPMCIGVSNQQGGLGPVGLGGSGSGSSALGFGGNRGLTTYTLTRLYNGVTWVSQANLTHGKTGTSGCGSSSLALNFGGSIYVEKFSVQAYT